MQLISFHHCILLNAMVSFELSVNLHQLKWLVVAFRKGSVLGLRKLCWHYGMLTHAIKHEQVMQVKHIIQHW